MLRNFVAIRSKIVKRLYLSKVHRNLIFNIFKKKLSERPNERVCFLKGRERERVNFFSERPEH